MQVHSPFSMGLNCPSPLVPTRNKNRPVKVALDFHCKAHGSKVDHSVHRCSPEARRTQNNNVQQVRHTAGKPYAPEYSERPTISATIRLRSHVGMSHISGKIGEWDPSLNEQR